MSIRLSTVPGEFSTVWEDLLQTVTVTSESTARQLFQTYAARVEILTKDQKLGVFRIEKSQNLAIRGALRDFYMRFHLEHNLEEVGRIVHIAKMLLPEEQIFRDIDAMLCTPFNNDWALLQHYYDFLFRTSDSNTYHSLVNKLIDGNPLTMSREVNPSPLMRYRFVYISLVHYASAYQDTSLNSGLVRAKRAARRALRTDSKRFNEKSYYYTVLRTDAKLRETLPSFLKLCSKEVGREVPADFGADQLADMLVSDNTEKSLEALEFVRKARQFFSDYFQKLQFFDDSPVHYWHEQIVLMAGVDKPYRDAILEQLMQVSLPSNISKRVVHDVCDGLRADVITPPHEKLKKICLLAQWLFTTCTDSMRFEDEIKPIILLSHSISEELKALSSQAIIQNVWKKMFSESCTDQLVHELVMNLNMECARTIRLMTPEDFRPKKEEKEVATLDLKFVAIDPKRKSISHTDLKPVPIDQNKKSASDIALRNAGPEITAANLSDRITLFIAYYIVTAKSDEIAAINIAKSIHLAHKALEPPYVNLFLSKAIYLGLVQASVDRLKRIWAKLSPEDLESFKKLEELFSLVKNSIKSREYRAQSRYPVIPDIALISLELTHGYEAEANEETAAQIKQMEMQFNRIRLFLKAVLPVKQGSTDAVITLSQGVEALRFKRPLYKRDFEVKIPIWKPGEWESMDPLDKLFFISRSRWH